MDIQKPLFKTNEALIEEVKLGSRTSFEVLYERHKHSIFNYLYRLLGRKELAEDCTQEVFIRVYEKAKLYSPTSKFSSWLYKMAKNSALDALRKNKVRKAASLDDPIESEEGSAVLSDFVESREKDPRSISASSELADWVRCGIAKLPETDRQILILCDIQQLSHKEVGEILGYSAETVTVKLYRARQRLGEILKIEGD